MPEGTDQASVRRKPQQSRCVNRRNAAIGSEDRGQQSIPCVQLEIGIRLHTTESLNRPHSEGQWRRVRERDGNIALAIRDTRHRPVDAGDGTKRERHSAPESQRVRGA